jgi:hypothetical protein
MTGPMRRTLCLLAVAASLAVSSAASAQQQQPPPDPVAVKHFLAGKALRDAGDCKGAIGELNQSIEKEKSIGAFYNLGFCHEKTGNKKLALLNYKLAEDLAKKRGDDRQREIGAQIRFFFDQTTHIRLVLPQPAPADMQVLIDGEALPNEEFEGLQIYFPPSKRASYELRVSASGYEDIKLPISAETVDGKLAVSFVLKKIGEGGPVKPEPRIIGEKWGPFQYLGLGLIAVGAFGVSYTGIAFGSYKVTEGDLRGKFTDAEGAAAGCPSSSQFTEPNSTCGKNVKTREELRTEYNDNEAFGKRQTGLWLGFAIGGAVAIGSGVLLILFAPRTDIYSTDAGATAKAPPPRPTFRVVPNVGLRESGLSVVGTF